MSISGLACTHRYDIREDDISWCPQAHKGCSKYMNEVNRLDIRNIYIMSLEVSKTTTIFHEGNKKKQYNKK